MRGAVTLAAYGLALLLHGVPVAAYLTWSSTEIGGQGNLPSSISIEIIQGDAEESNQTPTATASGGSKAAIQDDSGQPATEDRLAVDEMRKAADEKPIDDKKPPEALVPERDVTSPIEVAAAPDKQSERELPPDPPKEDVKPEPAITPGQAQFDQAAVDGSVAGGVQTRSIVEAPTVASAPAAASPGEIAHYAMHVRKALSRSLPKHVGRRGRVVISFGIGRDGRLQYAEVTASSGYDQIDVAALEAVRKAKFPRPPEGMPEKSLTYIVPFGFE